MERKRRLLGKVLLPEHIPGVQGLLGLEAAVENLGASARQILPLVG
jgi:hypothetical protein